MATMEDFNGIEEPTEVNPTEVDEQDVQDVDPNEVTDPEQVEDNGNQFYTVEEMKALSPDEIDTSRIPEEMVPFYKSLQAGYTKKFQSLAEERKQLQLFQQQMQQAQQQQQPARTLEEAFDKDPRGVMQAIDAEIAKKIDEDPMEAMRLQNVRLQLSERRMQQQEQYSRANQMVVQTQAQIKSAIPDFDTKAEKLTEFATTLGFTPDELGVLTDPARTGAFAAKLTLALNSAYDMMHSGASLKNKQVKNPTKVESAGAGLKPKANASLDSYKQKAMSSGSVDDWANYYEMKSRIKK